MQAIDYKKGISLVLLTAIVSGFSIFINSFVVKGLNPFIFTTTKNIIVALFLISLILLLKEFNELKKLSIKQWTKLIIIGLIGGSIPFWIYFYAIKIGSEIYSTPYGIVAGFFHKSTLFVFVAILATFFLKEKISKEFIVGGLLLLLGNYLLAKNFFTIGFPELIVFIAIILWAIENVISKFTLRELSGNQVAFGRMFFGSIILMLMLVITGQANEFLAFEPKTLFWSFITAIPLFLYVFFWYNGLKHIEVSKATTILMLGQPITSLLTFTFNGVMPNIQEIISSTLIISGIILVIGYSNIVGFINKFLATRRITQ